MKAECTTTISTATRSDAILRRMNTLDQLKAELEQVNAAISAAYTGKRYAITTGGIARELERQPLNVLLDRKRELEAIINRASGGGISFGMPV